MHLIYDPGLHYIWCPSGVEMRSTWLYIANNSSNHAQTDNHHNLHDPSQTWLVRLDTFCLWVPCVSSAILPLDASKAAPLGGVPW